MVQWTAAIRLCMFEHTSLYEAYTGSLIAGKGKHLNGIQTILAPTRYKYEDWARVRFGAGTPWRRCWFVINPPDDKEMQKAKKALRKSAYDRLSVPVTGNIEFYETKKTKKVKPIATLTHVYSAYAIYPQTKALMDHSSLVKLEGRVTMNSQPATEGYVFVMPELHAAVSGVEMMMRFLFPTFDTFNLYGRPTRLVADTNHIKSIMFAFPRERRYGYLDVLDIVNLLQIPGSQDWSEAEWRKQLKEATMNRMSTGRSRTNSVNSARPRYRSSASIRNGEVPNDSYRRPYAPFMGKPEFNRSTEAVIREAPQNDPAVYHARGMSDVTDMQNGSRPRQIPQADSSPNLSARDLASRDRTQNAVAPIAERSSSESEPHPLQTGAYGQPLPPRTPPSPVASPPAFSHGPRAVPTNRPEADSEQRLAHNRMSHATLSQMSAVGKTGGSAVTFKDQQSNSRIDEQPQIESPANTAPDTAASKNPSGEVRPAIAFALPVRQSQRKEEDRPKPAKSPAPPSNLQLDTSKSVKRKPVPQRQYGGDAQGEPSYDDLRHTLDENALDQIAPPVASPVSPNRTDEGSIYDDAASTVSPDYASTHGSIYSKKSVTRPRMGVMKTVGEPAKQDLVIGDAHYSTDKPAEPNPDIPSVDFGPTLTYMPTTGRPETGETLRKTSHQRHDSEAERLKLSVPTNPLDRGHSRSPSQGQEEYRRSVLWQPGMTTGRPTTPGGGLTPEQYVQRRAAPSPPMQMHHRATSNHTPPPQRPASGDWAHHVRPNSRMTSYQDPNYRPSSRGAGPMLNYNDMSNHLSAREQEHVARMTGSSFFNMSSDNRKSQAPINPAGLVSAIDAREREKREMKEGMSNHLVQNAIAHRQQHMGQQYQHAPQYVGQPQYSGHVYPPHPQPRQEPMYNIPGASRTWDALNQINRNDEPRRQSWYGHLGQIPRNPPSYQQSQHHAQHGGYPNNFNATHY